VGSTCQLQGTCASDDAKTVPGVLGYVDTGTGDKYMLVIHQAILVPKMTVNLLGLQ